VVVTDRAIQEQGSEVKATFMSNFLSGKRALVTGASKGIGLEVARALSFEGADVVICGRDQGQLDKALADLKQSAPKAKFASQKADVSSSEQVAELFSFTEKTLGGLDILINNAGIGIFRPASELTVEEWNRVIGINLSGAFYCTHEALPRFKQAGGGFIINISSLAGKNPFAGGAAYNSSKFGMNALSEATMLDHRQENVRVSYIMPGSVDTHFSGEGAGGKSDWKIAPEDIAEIVIDILRLPVRTLISRVEVRPSRPQKN
jgi:NAD(P)-dependent dehydrogenase (short-subunit alcohol dehydrogenase family)